MAIIVNKSDGTVLVEIADQQIDTSYSTLSLIGIGAQNYPEVYNENLVRLLENSAKTTPPVHPLTGQFWYDKSTSAVKVYNGGWRSLAQNDPSTVIPGGMVGGGQGQTLASPLFVSVDSNNGLVALVSSGKVIAVISHHAIAKVNLPTSLAVGSDTLTFQSRFPNGITAGITMATDMANYSLAGTVTTAQTAATAAHADTCDLATNATHANAATTATTATTAAAVVGSVDARGHTVNFDANQIPLAAISGLAASLQVSTLPIGSIILWHGIFTDIPSGWAACNGFNGTPNLSGSVVVGASNVLTGYDPHNVSGHINVNSASGTLAPYHALIYIMKIV